MIVGDRPGGFATEPAGLTFRANAPASAPGTPGEYDAANRLLVVASLAVLPSLTESGRVRGEGSPRLRRELVSDLFFEISVHDSYDSQSSEGSEKNDWGLSTSLGYSF